MVPKSTCASPYIPTVIIKSINVPLHRDWVALLQLLKQFICRLLTRHWHLSTAYQRNGTAVSGKSPRGLTFLSIFFSFSLPLRDSPETTSSSLLTRDFLPVETFFSYSEWQAMLSLYFCTISWCISICNHVIFLLWRTANNKIDDALISEHLTWERKLEWYGKSINWEGEHITRVKRSSCLDLLQLQQFNVGWLVMTSAPYYDVMISPRHCVCVCVFMCA